MSLPLPDTGEKSSDDGEIYFGFEEWCIGRGIDLYPAQEEAVLEAVAGSNVIVSTPTGSGKSLVALGAHYAAVRCGMRTFYTAPLKALVSEKFFALVEAFGAENVGMMTGDVTVNPDAPVVCATAEIVANLALRHGADADIGQVVMDEFHFYADPQRGWAWQVPIVELPHVQFVLMSATLGDVTRLADDLTERTGRHTAVVASAERPVPLHFYYSEIPLLEQVEELLDADRAPIYIVHFSQAAALERAQGLASAGIADRELRDKIADEVAGFRFTTGFGKTLRRLLRLGVGVHHAGMLPKYRRLVEQLAQRGLLKIICGTDTLGVGINVPIRTVLLSGLTKFDGSVTRRLKVREFQQIAGRAGRAGYDDAGTVVVQAPEHVIENERQLKKAGDDPKKRRKVVKKKALAGFVSWGQGTFERLRDGVPEQLTSHMTINHSMVINLLARGGDVISAARHLIESGHESRARQLELEKTGLKIYRSLLDAAIVHRVDTTRGVKIELTADLQTNFALNQPLSPFAVAAFDLLDEESDDYALDVVSVIEATLDNPRAVLAGQLNLAKGEAVAEMKAAGIDYDERMEQLEEVTHPKPLHDLLTETYEYYRAGQPWITDFDVAPKSVVRDMFTRAMTFNEYVAFYRLTRTEGALLRYLADAYRALKQTVPEARKNEPVTEIIEWLGELVRQVDSSLFDEWAALEAGTGGDAASDAGDTAAVRPPGQAASAVTANPRAFLVLVRNAMFRRVDLAAKEDYDALGAMDSAAGWNPHRWRAAMEDYYDRYNDLGIDQNARSPQMLLIEKDAGLWRVRQIFDDPDGDHDWGISAGVDLAASDDEGEPVIEVTDVGPL